MRVFRCPRRRHALRSHISAYGAAFGAWPSGTLAQPRCRQMSRRMPRVLGARAPLRACAIDRMLLRLGRERPDRFELVADHTLTLRADRRVVSRPVERDVATGLAPLEAATPAPQPGEDGAVDRGDRAAGPHAASAWPPGQEEGPHDRPPDRPARGGAATRLQREHRKAAWHPDYQTR